METLKKVNTQGMSKLSSFFAKVPPKPKEKVVAGGGNKRKAAGA